MTPDETDPFAGLTDELPLDGAGVRSRLLAEALRGYAPLRKVFVQRPSGSETRASVLAAMVTARQERALDAFLLIHALMPVLSEDPLPLATWARMLNRGRTPCTLRVASAAFRQLVDYKLITREDRGRKTLVTPLLEDGSGDGWTRPGRTRHALGHGYLTIPYAYWTNGLVDRLQLAGKAMFLIMLSETSVQTTFSMAVERAPAWYGISERTAERGYKQLRDVGVLLEHRQFVNDPRSPTGFRAVWHRTLAPPFSTAARHRLQMATRAAVHRKLERAATPTGSANAPKARRGGEKRDEAKGTYTSRRA
ncbi:hypothetical protein [Rhizocola hellebori]|uniref:hypothetical protein n=1 Tax=Rhizocola hellebori TaxID=1392758 RepID=UPI001940D81C|nr:hypothetical protein [Rhizocola hellebori]